MNEGLSEFDRGVKEGKDDATLASNTQRLDALNGHLAELVDRVTDLADQGRLAREGLADAIRTLQEEGRAAVLALEVAAETLAKETERRRSALADEGTTTDRRLSSRTATVGLFALAIPFVIFLLGYYLLR